MFGFFYTPWFQRLGYESIEQVLLWDPGIQVNYIPIKARAPNMSNDCHVKTITYGDIAHPIKNKGTA